MTATSIASVSAALAVLQPSSTASGSAPPETPSGPGSGAQTAVTVLRHAGKHAHKSANDNTAASKSTGQTAAAAGASPATAAATPTASAAPQDTIVLSPAAQTATAAPSGSKADGIILQLANSLASGDSATVDASIQTLTSIVADTSLAWSLVDQQTAQAALSDVATSGISLSAADQQAISQALGQTALDARLQTIGSAFGYALMYIQRPDVAAQKELDVFSSLSAADQQLWFTTNIQPNTDFKAITDYTVNLQAIDAVNSIVQNAIANKTISKTESYAQVAAVAPAVADAMQFLTDAGNQRSSTFTSAAITFLMNTQFAAFATHLQQQLTAQSALGSFNDTTETTPTGADQALTTLQSNPTDTPDDIALQTLKNVLKQIAAEQGKTPAQDDGTSNTTASSTATTSATTGASMATPGAAISFTVAGKPSSALLAAAAIMPTLGSLVDKLV